MFRGTVSDSGAETFLRFLDEFIAALEPYAQDLAHLRPPSDAEEGHAALVRATDELLSNSRALRQEFASSGRTTAVLGLLSKQGDAYVAFDVACGRLLPDYSCGALIERR